MKKILASILIALIFTGVFLPRGVFAAIALDAVTGSQYGKTTGVTKAHTTGSGENRLMLVGIANGKADAAPISSIAYNGDALTHVHTVYNGSLGVDIRYYYLVNPDSGNNNLVINFSGTAEFNYYIVTLTGVDQSSPTGAEGSDSGNEWSSSATISTLANSWIFDMSSRGTITAGYGWSQGADQTQIHALNQNFDPYQSSGGSRKGPVSAGNNTTSQTYTYASAAQQIYASIEVKEVQSAAASGRRLRGSGITR